MDSPAACSGPVVAEDNIINRRGGESLYQTCANLKRRLAEVPGFEPYLAEIDLPNEDGENDPVAAVWQCLRSGYPLVTIYNASNPPEPIVLDEGNIAESKRPKLAAFKFVQAVLSDFRCPQQDCFLLTDLYSESTTGFVKVCLPSLLPSIPVFYASSSCFPPRLCHVLLPHSALSYWLNLQPTIYALFLSLLYLLANSPVCFFLTIIAGHQNHQQNPRYARGRGSSIQILNFARKPCERSWPGQIDPPSTHPQRNDRD